MAVCPGQNSHHSLVAMVTSSRGQPDAADAIGAHAPPARRLEILRDSRVGTYGALALVFAVVFPLVVLTPLDDGDFLRAALVGHVVGRWSILPQSLLLPAARPDGAGALIAVATVPFFRHTLGGATGDTFGALTKVVELACYAALVAMWA